MTAEYFPELPPQPIGSASIEDPGRVRLCAAAPPIDPPRQHPYTEALTAIAGMDASNPLIAFAMRDIARKALAEGDAP